MHYFPEELRNLLLGRIAENLARGYCSYCACKSDKFVKKNNLSFKVKQVSTWLHDSYMVEVRAHCHACGTTFETAPVLIDCHDINANNMLSPSIYLDNLLKDCSIDEQVAEYQLSHEIAERIMFPV